MLIKKVIFKTCAPFTSCIAEIDNTQADNLKILILKCLCTTQQNKVMLIRRHQKVYGNTIEMNQL